MEVGFCDLVSLTGAWPQKHCWEGTSGVLIYEHFFLAYDSELRCSQEKREQKMKIISVALPCFVRAGGCWWWDWQWTVRGAGVASNFRSESWYKYSLSDFLIGMHRTLSCYSQHQVLSSLCFRAPGEGKKTAIKTVKSGNWSLALGSLSCVQISSGFAGFTLERRLSQCSSLQSGQTWFLFSSHHYYNDRE